MATKPFPYPFIPKDNSSTTLRTISASPYNSFLYGDEISGSFYPLTSSLSTNFLYENHNSNRIISLKNTLNYYINLSKHYSLSSSYGDKLKQEMTLLSVPSIFYGSSIRKGSVNLKWFLTGTLIAELSDVKRNGELIQIGPSGSNGSGSCAGVVLYNEGFVLLTGSWNLHPTYTDLFGVDLTYKSPSWKYFMHTGSNDINLAPSSSFDFEFEGVNYIQTLTMMAHADKGEFNHSNNPTYLKKSEHEKLTITGSDFFIENTTKQIKNIIKTNYSDVEPGLEKITYISQIGIYDEEKNLIAIAKLSNPVRKRTNDNYLFKVKIDI
jgi:hypothetical protein